MQNLDEMDKQLLRLLQVNNRTTAEELGYQIGLSTSAVQRRLKRLRDQKVIVADVSIVSPEAAGMTVGCIVDVTLHLGNSTVIDSFKDLMNTCPLVKQCYYVTGLYDFVLVVETPSMQAYEAFSKQYLMDNPSVRQFYTHVIMDPVKLNFTVRFDE